MSDIAEASKFTAVPVTDLINPRKHGPLMVYKDYYWAVDEQGNAFFYKGKSYSPQCNVNKTIVERHLANGLSTHAEFLPWAYVQFSISDYS